MTTRLDIQRPASGLVRPDFPLRPRPPLRFSRPTIVTFDDVADGAVVDTQYAAQGVRFASVGTNPARRWSCYARAAWGIESAPNGVSVVAPPQISLFDARQGQIEATFDRPQHWVSVDAQPVLPPEHFGTPTAGPYIEAYAADGRLLGRTRYPLAFGAPGWGGWQMLTVSAPGTAIARVVISSSFEGPVPVYALFDRLAFGTEPSLLPGDAGG